MVGLVPPPTLPVLHLKGHPTHPHLLHSNGLWGQQVERHLYCPFPRLEILPQVSEKRSQGQKGRSRPFRIPSLTQWFELHMSSIAVYVSCIK